MQAVAQSCKNMRRGTKGKQAAKECPGGPNFNPLDFVPEETMVVTLSREGYIKRQSLTEYRSQRRGGQGKAAAKLKEGDEIDRIITASSHDQALCFSNFGRV